MGRTSDLDRSEPEPKRLPSSWQERLLPLMIRMIVGLALFFFVASFVQLAYLHQRIGQAPPIDLADVLTVRGSASELTPDQALAVAEFRAVVALEANAIERRYHQANVLLMTRAWARYLGFVTGMILALVGGAFILGKLQEPVSEFASNLQGMELTLRSASPGLVLAVLGVALMITTIVTHHDIETRDLPVFLRSGFGVPGVFQVEQEQPPLD